MSQNNANNSGASNASATVENLIKQYGSRHVVGNLEVCSLPDLAISELEVRVDTGAKTSSLHVDNIKTCKLNGKRAVQFDIHPDIHNVDRMVTCKAEVHDIRRIKSSNGAAEQRYVIKTPIQLGDINWDIEITLTNRADMSYLMLLGREALGNRFLVDPSDVYICSEVNSD